MIKTVRFKKWQVLVNDISVLLAGAHTWFLLQFRPGEKDLLTDWLDYGQSLGWNFQRLWWGWRSGVQEPLSPEWPSQDAYDRLVFAVDECLKRNMVPMVMVCTWYGKGNWEFNEGPIIKKMAAALKGKPFIWEVANEVPVEGYVWQKQMVFEIKKHSDQPIVVNGNSKANESALRKSGAHGYAMIANTSFQRAHNLVGIWDTDHLVTEPDKVLNETRASKKIDSSNRAKSKGLMIHAHMRSIEGSVLKDQTYAVNRPDNPSFLNTDTHMGQIATSLGDLPVDPPIDPPDPPVDPPVDPPPIDPPINPECEPFTAQDGPREKCARANWFREEIWRLNKEHVHKHRMKVRVNATAIKNAVCNEEFVNQEWVDKIHRVVNNHGDDSKCAKLIKNYATRMARLGMPRE